MATYVLVHGAWHQGSVWERVAPLLEQHGHTVITPSLAMAAGTGLAEHVKQLEQALTTTKDPAGPVVLVPHSYAGIPASQAVLRTGVVDRLVLVDAWLAPAGSSLLDVAPEWFRQWCHTSATGEPPVLPVPPLWSVGIEEDSPDAAWLTPRLVTQPLATFTDPVETTMDPESLDVLGVERHALLCTPEAMPFRSFAMSAGCAIEEIECGHDVMVSRPQALAALLLRHGH